MKTALNYVGALTLICAVAAGVLAFTNEVTTAPIAQARQRVTMSAVQTVLPSFNKLADASALKASLEPGAPEMYAAFQDSTLVGAAIKVTDPDGFGGDVSFMVGVTADGKVHAIRVLTHKETPGLGSKLAEQKFFGQFDGVDVPAGGLKVTKDGGNIQAITGATISSRTAVRSATKAVETFRKYATRLSGAAASAAPVQAEGGPRG